MERIGPFLAGRGLFALLIACAALPAAASAAGAGPLVKEDGALTLHISEQLVHAGESTEATVSCSCHSLYYLKIEAPAMHGVFAAQRGNNYPFAKIIFDTASSDPGVRREYWVYAECTKCDKRISGSFAVAGWCDQSESKPIGPTRSAETFSFGSGKTTLHPAATASHTFKWDYKPEEYRKFDKKMKYFKMEGASTVEVHAFGDVDGTWSWTKIGVVGVDARANVHMGSPISQNTAVTMSFTKREGNPFTVQWGFTVIFFGSVPIPAPIPVLTQTADDVFNERIKVASGSLEDQKEIHPEATDFRAIVTESTDAVLTANQQVARATLYATVLEGIRETTFIPTP